MSPHAMTSLVSDLVEMAKATEMLPQVQAECDRLREQHVKDGDTIADREIRIMELSNEVADLNSRIRSLEVERDDYGFRALAADDKANALAAVLRTTQATVEAALKAAEPEAPLPTPEASTSGLVTPVAVSSETHSGDGVGSPTQAPEPGPAIGEVVTVPITTASPDYSRSLYINHPGWVSREDWLAGGGTAETYDWREGQPLPDGWYYGSEGKPYHWAA